MCSNRIGARGSRRPAEVGAVVIRVRVVEDDPAAAARLVGHLRRFEREHGATFDVEVFGDGDALVEDYRPEADVLLLDIQMPGTDGITAARRVRELDGRVLIIFVTNAAASAVKGYEVGARGFLLKPVTYAAVSQHLRRAVAEVARRRNDRSVVLPVAGGQARLAVADIVYLESGRRHTVVRTVDAKYQVPRALTWIEDRLAGSPVFRSNKCYLVNLAHVAAVDRQDCVMSTGERLAISRLRRTALMAALTDHLAHAPTVHAPLAT